MRWPFNFGNSFRGSLDLLRRWMCNFTDIAKPRDVSAAKGGSRSERAGDVPLPKGSASSGTVEEGQAAKP